MPNTHDMTPATVNVERHNEIKKASFWVSQLFILLATVCGVYLAANQGFKQAVEFENMNTYKDGYYLQSSLQYELQDNIVILQAYMAKIQDGNYAFTARKEPLNFYTLVWDNMKFSPSTLATPPDILRNAQRFYREVAQIHRAIADSDISNAVGVKRLQAEIDMIEQTTIPRIEKLNAEIKAKLEQTDVIL